MLEHLFANHEFVSGHRAVLHSDQDDGMSAGRKKIVGKN
jgi:hypothetical protein